MATKQPPFIKKGDKIGVVSTARKVNHQELNPCIEIISQMGYMPILGKNIFSEYNQFAGTVEQRLSDLQVMLDDDSIKAILCARGGYGTVQIIDKVDFSIFSNHPKWIAGYSDVTVLHSHINNHLNISTIHSTMPINFPKDNTINKSVETLFQVLSGNIINYTFPSHLLNIEGEMKGELIGGNLSILYSLTGTASLLSLNNKILFFEDLDEYLYHIDRMLMNLKRSGALKNIKGVLIGGMSEMHDNTVPYGKSAEQIVFDNLKELNIPIAFNFPAGHIEENYAFILGSEVQVNVSKNSNTIFSYL
ncbi:MAG: LD-carboxypeptidase [Bacteroidota bacterium]